MDKRVSKNERRWVWGFAVFILFLVSAPYFLAIKNQGELWRFTGFVIAVEDGNSYIAKMLWGHAGNWSFRTPYTSFEQAGVVAFLPYLILGKLAPASNTHSWLIILFHVFRVIGGAAMVHATFDFISRFVYDPRLRKLSLVLATVGGGLGWVLIATGNQGWLGSLPLEFYSPETFGFLSIFTLPHLALARALLFWGLLIYLGDGKGDSLENVAREQLIPGIKIGGMWLLMGLMNPLTIPIAFAVVGVHFGGYSLSLWWRASRKGEKPDLGLWWVHLSRVVWAGLISGPLALYSFLRFGTDPFLREWTSQNLILSPHPAHYIAAFSVVLPFAIWGMRGMLHRFPRAGWLPVMWVIAFPLLAYAPYNLQRRLPDGIWVAQLILAFSVLDGRKISRLRMRSIVALTFIFLLPSTILILAGSTAAVSNPGEPIFRPAAEARAFEFLAENAPPDSVVLTSFDTGNALPAWAPLRVVIGHGPESIRLAQIRPEVTSFYSGSSNESDRLIFVDEYHVKYVFWSPAEKYLGDWDPNTASFLQQIYNSDGYSVFIVK